MRIVLLLFLPCFSVDSILADTAAPPPYFDVTYMDENNEPWHYTRTDFYREGNLFVVINRQNNQLVGSSGFPVPKQFVHMVKVDSTINISSPKGIAFTLPDSIGIVDNAAVDSFYRNTPSIRIDTIYVNGDKVTDHNRLQDYSIRSLCRYHAKEKDGKETGYYGINELKGKTVTGHFRVKYTGRWRKGQQHGKWKYYAPDGKLVAIEKWRKGKLRREKKLK